MQARPHLAFTAPYMQLSALIHHASARCTQTRPLAHSRRAGLQANWNQAMLVEVGGAGPVWPVSTDLVALTSAALYAGTCSCGQPHGHSQTARLSNRTSTASACLLREYTEVQ